MSKKRIAVLLVIALTALATSAVSAQTLTCTINAPTTIDENQVLDVTFECDGVSGAYGFELEHSMEDSQITPSSGGLTIGVEGVEYILGRGATSTDYAAGTIFQGQATLDGAYQHDQTGGLYALSLNQGTAVTGDDLTLAEAQYYLPQPGTLTISVDSLILGDESGVNLDPTLTVDPVNVTINDLALASLRAYVTREAYGAGTNFTDFVVTIGGEAPAETSDSGNSMEFIYEETLALDATLLIDAPSHLECTTASFALNDEDNVLGTVTLWAGDVVDSTAIDINDATAIGLKYGNDEVTDEEEDVNDDGIINILDLIHVGRNYTKTTGDCTFS